MHTYTSHMDPYIDDIHQEISSERFVLSIFH